MGRLKRFVARFLPLPEFAVPDSVPDPPVNVRIVTYDGAEIPVDCTYRGFNGFLHVWDALTVVPDSGYWGARVDVMPANTSIVFRTEAS